MSIVSRISSETDLNFVDETDDRSISEIAHSRIVFTSESFDSESSFILDKQKGIERIYVIAAPEADPKLEELGRQLNNSSHETVRNRIGAELMEYLDTKELTRATLPGATFTMDGSGGSEVKIDADKLKTSNKRVYLLEFEHR